MAKQSGLGDNAYIDGYDLSNDTLELSRIAGGPAALVITGIDKSAFERIGGQRTGEIAFKVAHNDAALQAHPALSPQTGAAMQVMYFRGTTLGNPAAGMIARQVDYAATRANDGMLSYDVQCLSDGFGLEWGTSLTAGKRTDTAATNGTGVDFAAASSFGLQMYTQLFSFTGTSVTIKVQESSDNGGGDAFADVTGATTGALTTRTTVRVATATNLAVERYLRVVTTGTFSSAVFAVMVVRNSAVPTF